MQKQLIELSRIKKQQGATLVVALVILLVMSMVGLASLSSSTLQSRMAFNKKQKMLSILSADAALKLAERYVKENIKQSSDRNIYNGADGLFSSARIDTGSGLAIEPVKPEGKFSGGDVTLAMNWLNDNSVEIESDEGIGPELSINRARYFIEYLGKYDPSASIVFDPVSGNPDTRPYMFRVVAIGWGQDSNIYSVLQSVFRTGSDVEYN